MAMCSMEVLRALSELRYVVLSCAVIIRKDLLRPYATLVLSKFDDELLVGNESPTLPITLRKWRDEVGCCQAHSN